MKLKVLYSKRFEKKESKVKNHIFFLFHGQSLTKNLPRWNPIEYRTVFQLQTTRSNRNRFNRGVPIHTLYNAILRIARNFLETRENIKISTHPFYHTNLDWFSWEWSKKKELFFLKKKIQNGRFFKITCLLPRTTDAKIPIPNPKRFSFKLS